MIFFVLLEATLTRLFFLSSNNNLSFHLSYVVVAIKIAYKLEHRVASVLLDDVTPFVVPGICGHTDSSSLLGASEQRTNVQRK